MDPDKQLLVLNAALKEFTEKGFEQASTNQIVKEAGIGKGMLFYYFESKKKLYFYLIDHCMEIIEKKYLDLIDTSESDLFERLKKMAAIKLEFLKEHPDAMNFIATVLLKKDAQIDKKLKLQIELLQEIGSRRMYDNIDFSHFREDIDASKAFKLVQWAFHGYEEEMKFRLRAENLASIDYDPYWEEFYDYLDVMKTSFYKQS